MTRIHAFVIALAVAFAVVAGAFAAFRTTQLGAASPAKVSPVVLAAQTRRLDDSAAKVHRALRTRLPALPPVPRVKKAKLPTGTPPAVVRVVHIAAPATTTATTTTTTTPAAPPPSITQAHASTPTTTPTSTTTHRTHERETGHDTGSDDAYEHTSTTSATGTTTTTPSGGGAPDD